MVVGVVAAAFAVAVAALAAAVACRTSCCSVAIVVSRVGAVMLELTVEIV